MEEFKFDALLVITIIIIVLGFYLTIKALIEDIRSRIERRKDKYKMPPTAYIILFGVLLIPDLSYAQSTFFTTFETNYIYFSTLLFIIGVLIWRNDNFPNLLVRIILCLAAVYGLLLSLKHLGFLIKV